MIKFTYDNNYNSTTYMVPFEVLYERKYISHVYQDEIGERKLLGSQSIHKDAEIIKKGSLKTIVSSEQTKKTYANKKRRHLQFKIEIMSKCHPLKCEKVRSKR